MECEVLPYNKRFLYLLPREKKMAPQKRTAKKSAATRKAHSRAAARSHKKASNKKVYIMQAKAHEHLVRMDEIIGSTRIDPRRIEQQVWTEGLVLGLPLLAAFGYYANIILRSAGTISGEQFAPGRAEPLVIAIFLFIVVYSIFLIFKFRQMKLMLETVKKGG